ncbi:MAG: hypothetical protein ABJG75_10280, partial [Roseobacter sp.]
DLPAKTHKTVLPALPALVPSSPNPPILKGIESANGLPIKEEFFNTISSNLPFAAFAKSKNWIFAIKACFLQVAQFSLRTQRKSGFRRSVEKHRAASAKSVALNRARASFLSGFAHLLRCRKYLG